MYLNKLKVATQSEKLIIHQNKQPMDRNVNLITCMYSGISLWRVSPSNPRSLASHLLVTRQARIPLGNNWYMPLKLCIYFNRWGNTLRAPLPKPEICRINKLFIFRFQNVCFSIASFQRDPSDARWDCEFINNQVQQFIETIRTDTTDYLE